jgi:hypothetical protein
LGAFFVWKTIYYAPGVDQVLSDAQRTGHLRDGLPVGDHIEYVRLEFRVVFTQCAFVFLGFHVLAILSKICVLPF